MIKAFIDLLVLAAFVIFCYYTAILLIRLWMGNSAQDAQNILHNFISGKSTMKMEQDSGLISEIDQAVHNVVGDERYTKLIGLSSSLIFQKPLIFIGIFGGHPIIEVTVNPQDDNEKIVLKNVISNVVVKYLQIYGHDTLITSNWTTREDLKMPMLQIGYANTTEERRALAIEMQSTQKTIVATSAPITDDYEDGINE